MSNPDSGYRSGFLYRPGFKAFEAGVKHAMYAQNMVEVLYPNKKQKVVMAPVSSQKYVKPRRSKYTKKTSFKPSSVVKKTILSMAATYHDTQNDTNLAQNMTHNNLYSNNLTAKVTQGLNGTGRQGDQIFITGVRIKGNYVTNPASNGYQFRLIIGWSGEEYDPTTLGSSGAGTGLTPADVFLENTGGHLLTSAPINPKAFTALYDQVIDLSSQLSATQEIQHLDAYVPLRKKFPYQALGSVYGKSKNLYVVCLAGVSGGGVPLTTAVGSVNMNSVLSFKNL